MPTKILIVRFSSIGDIVLTTPVLRQLKQQLDGETEIHYLTKASFAPIVESIPYVHKVWHFEDNLDALIEELKKEEFDYLIDLHKNFRSSKVKNHLKLLTFSFDKLNWEKWLLVNFGINKMPDIHIVDRYLSSAKSFDLNDDGKGLDYFIPPHEEIEIGALHSELKKGYLVWVLGAAHPGKRLSSERTISILKSVKHPVVLLGGKAEEEMAKEVDAAVGSHSFNFCGQLSIHGSASVIKQAAVVVSPDTGMMHIAAALKKNIISLWGCTVPELGMYPYRPGEQSVMLQPHGLSKRPCSKLGDKCKYKGYCINRIDEQEVTSAIDKIFT